MQTMQKLRAGVWVETTTRYYEDCQTCGNAPATWECEPCREFLCSHCRLIHAVDVHDASGGEHDRPIAGYSSPDW